MTWRQTAALCLVLGATVVFAAAPQGGHDRIRKHDGTVLVGNIVSELEKGYLFQTSAGASVMIPYAEVAEVTKAAGPPAPTAAQPPAPAPAPAPGPAEAQTPCSPECRSGYVCRAGACQSACNPPCENGRVCTATQRCLDPDEAEDLRIDEERKDHLGAVARDSAGLHWGVQANLEFGPGHSLKSDFFSGARAAAVANYRLGSIDVRGSLGPLVLISFGDPISVGPTLDIDVHFLLSSRFALGVGARAGVLFSEQPLECNGPGCGAVDTTVAPAAIGGVKVMPAIFRLGSGRNLELSLTAAINLLSANKNGTPANAMCGAQFAYLFY